MSSSKYPIQQIPFRELNDKHFARIHQIHQELKYDANKDSQYGYIFDEPKYVQLKELPSKLGRIFFAFADGEIVGYLISFDSLEFKAYPNLIPYPAQALSNILDHEWAFIRDLSFVGRFSFIDQFGIEKYWQKRGVGQALFNYYEAYTKAKKTILLGAAIHEQNRHALDFLNRRKYRIVDFYPNTESNSNQAWWFRVINVVRQSAFLKAINADSLPLNSNITIPIQLNLATQHVNKLLRWIDARILWSSFFHFQNGILSKIFHLEKYYNGYYDTLLSCSREAFPEVVKTLKKMIQYLKEKDQYTSDEVPSLSPILAEEGFEFFLFNDQVSKHEFPAFTKPQKFNVLTFDIHSIFSQLALNSSLETYTRAENDQSATMLKSIVQDNPSEEFVEQWEMWKREKWLSKEEVNIVKKAIQYGVSTLNGFEKSKWRIIKARKRLPAIERKKWASWIELHKIIFSADKNSRYFVEEQTIWCHAVIPMTFSGGLSGVMFSFVVQKKESPSFSQLLNDLSYTISNAFAKNMFNILLKLQNNITTRHLMRYAIATVMTRNLSHNLGSHVLSKVASESTLGRYVAAIGRNRIGGLEHVAQLNAYLRTRMDFLADVSTSDPVTSLPRQLKQEVISRFKRERMLLENISSSDIRAIRIRFESTVTGEEDVIVQMPNGDLGNHALYVLFENLIRNVIKHEHKTFTERDSLSLTIRIENPEPAIDQSYYKVTIYDDVLRSSSDLSLIQRIDRSFIRAKSFTDSHEIRPDGLGIMEMKIAASYLRGKLPAKFVDTPLNPPLLQVVPVNPEPGTSSFYLGYELYLRKPQDLLLIGDTPQVHHQEWLNKGILTLSSSELDTSSNVFYTHNFLILLDPKVSRPLSKPKFFPLRSLDFRLPDEQSTFFHHLKESVSKAVNFCWLNWTEQLAAKIQLKQPRLEIHLSDSKRFGQIKALTSETLLLFDQHGDCGKFQPDGSQVVDPASLHFYEACPSTSPTGRIIRYLSKYNTEERELLNFQLIEAAMTRIILLDERIQKLTSEACPAIEIGHSSCIEQLEWMNISIPTVEAINLNNRDFGDLFKVQLSKWLTKQLERTHTHFLVIHLGLLEKLVGTKLFSIQNYLEDQIKEQYPDTEIVLISGRGKPAQLPRTCSFLNYSNVSDYVTNSRSKFHLCQILYSARSRAD